MAMIEWFLKGKEFGNCNCSYGCPCQFNALADARQLHGDGRLPIRRRAFRRCRAGRPARRGDVEVARRRASGQRHDAAHHRRARRPKQRDALVTMMSGKETKDMATMWWVYSAMCPTKLEPLFKPIEFEVDVDAPARAARGSRRYRNRRRADPQPGHRRRASRPDRSAERIRVPPRGGRQRHDQGDRRHQAGFRQTPSACAPTST